MSLEKDYSLAEVSDAIGMSERWIRDRIKFDGVECIRYGHKIRFTTAQVEALRAAHTKVPTVGASITTGRKRRA